MQRLQDDLQMLGMKIKGHEDNIKFLNAQNNKLDDLILDLQGIVFFFILFIFINVTNVKQAHLSKWMKCR